MANTRAKSPATAAHPGGREREPSSTVRVLPVFPVHRQAVLAVGQPAVGFEVD